MLKSQVFQVLRDGTFFWRSPNAVREQVRRDVALQILPTLLDLPLLPGEALPTQVVALLAQTPCVRLHGTVGSGRSLALLQVARCWHERGRDSLVLPLSLAEADVAGLVPYTILTNALRTIGVSTELDVTATSPKQPVLLLLDDWELLAPERQAEWRDVLVSLPQLWPRIRVVVALPATAEAWPRTEALYLAPPDDELLRVWLAHVLSPSDAEVVITGLASNEELRGLRQRLLDVALVAWTFPTHGMPESRQQLYDWAETLFQGATHRGQTEGIDPQARGIGMLSRACYAAAQDIAASEQLLILSDKSAAERAETALLLTTMVPDPDSLYRVLWSADPPAPEDLLAVGRCLIERPRDTPAWLWRVLSALVEQRESLPLQQVLHELAAHVPQMLAAHSGAEAPDVHLVQELASLLPTAALLPLLDNAALLPEVRWAVADALLQLPRTEVRQALRHVVPPDALAQAARCYLLAFGGPDDWQLLADAPVLEWLTTLQAAPIDPERRAQVFQRLLHSEGVPSVVRTTALAASPIADEPNTIAMLRRACRDEDTTVRHHALKVLRGYAAPQALALLKEVILAHDTDWSAQHDIIRELYRYHQAEASTLLAHCVVLTHLPLSERLTALVLLAKRPVGGPVLLHRLLGVKRLSPAVQAAVARLLGHMGDTRALTELRQLLVDDAPSIVQQGVVDALGLLGQAPAHRLEALAGVMFVLERSLDDVALTVSAMHALARLRAAESIPVLYTFLDPDVAERVQAAWVNHVTHLPELPPAKWSEASIPAEIRHTLLETLTAGATEADDPSNFDEALALQAFELRTAAAQALAQIGRHHGGEVGANIRSVLMQAVRRASTSADASAILRCLITVNDDNGLQDLGQLLFETALDPTLRWLVVEQLGKDAAALPLLIECLEHNVLDPFTNSKLVQAIAPYRSVRALASLRRIGEQSDGHFFLRVQAIEAIGLLRDPAAEASLLQLLTTVTTPPDIRAAAAEALAPHLRGPARDLLRRMLDRDRQPPALLAGILRTLGSDGDREALAQILRYAHHEDADVATAALGAIAEIGDASVAPNLIHVAQSTLRDQSVRLYAVGTLLRLCGAEFLPLLRSYLDSPLLSLQLQAFDYLLGLPGNELYVVQLATNRAAPLAMRLRAVDAAEHLADHEALHALLADNTDNPQLRVHVVALLRRRADAASIDALARCVQGHNTPLRVRAHCIAALAAIGDTAGPHTVRARLALSQIADSPHQANEYCLWATHALLASIHSKHASETPSEV